MADYFSGITPITPTYPVKPAQPVSKDREPGGRKKKRRQPERPPHRPDDNKDVDPHDSDNDTPTIDEHV